LRKNLEYTLIAVVVLGSVAGLYGAYKRYQAENLNKRVELALDFAEVKQQADLTGKSLQEVLKSYKEAGITSVAITEDTLAGLEARGLLRQDATTTGTSVYSNSPDALDRITAAIQRKGIRPTEKLFSQGQPLTVFSLVPTNTPSPHAFETFRVAADYTSIRNLGIGLDPAAINDVMAAGLHRIGRINNWIGISPQGIGNVLGELKKQNIQTVIFNGTDVLGYRGLDTETADALKAAGINYGQIEFGKQKGDEALGHALKGEYVRVHSIGEAELGLLDENEAIDRFVRGARERNIRLCYIRLFHTAGADVVQKNVEFLQRIRAGISRNGEMGFGAAGTYPETNAPSLVFLVTALGVGAGIALLKMRFWPLTDGLVLLAWAVGTLICVGAVVALGETGRKLVALVAALVFPTLACLRRDLLEPGVQVAKQVQSVGGSAASAIKGLAAASAVTAAGILMVVGLLATRPFMLKANQFLGIKAAHAIPILVIGAAAIFGLPRLDRSWREECVALKERATAFFAEPARVGQLLLALIALAVLLMIVARTGNEPGVGVSGVELKFRSLLDKILPVRPRTKEFLLGHPAFVLGLAFWFRGRRKIALPLFVVGVIGQVSILNTFCHVHTPLVLSLIRDLTGLAAGAAIGLAVFFGLERFLPKPGTPEAAGA
jgi:hypothetical protein